MPVDRRYHPRVNTNLEATVLATLRVRLLNVSASGILLGGNTQLHDLLLADPTTFPVEAEVVFELPQGPVRMTCRYIHTRRLSVDRFEMGFSILQHHGESQDRLEAFIAGQTGMV